MALHQNRAGRRLDMEARIELVVPGDDNLLASEGRVQLCIQMAQNGNRGQEHRGNREQICDQARHGLPMIPLRGLRRDHCPACPSRE